MTDAREIVARDLLKTYANYGLAVGERADLLIQSLSSAGFRILGPDEIDGPTVERCAEIALSHVNQTDYDLEPEAAVAENVTAKMIATAIRALKEGK